MKRGFTLLEVIGTLIITGIIIIISSFVFLNIINNAKEKNYQIQVKSIIEKVKDWGINNPDKIPSGSGIKFISLQTLINDKVVDNENIKDPRDNKIMNGCVVVTYIVENKQNDYRYHDKTCEELKNDYKPSFVYQNKKEVVEVNSVYTFSDSVQVTSVTGKNLSVKGPSIYKNDLNIDNMDTSLLDQEYKIKYTAYDDWLEANYVDEYTVKVVDTTKPVITIKHPEGVNTNTNDYSISHSVFVVQGTNYQLPTAEVKDNSCGIDMINLNVNECLNTLTYTTEGTYNTNQIGYYEIKYKAKDSKNNINTLILNVVVHPVNLTFENKGEYTYKIEVSGLYKIKGYGAQGGGQGGLGGYISAKVNLEKDDILKIRVGGTDGYNGGGAAGNDGYSGGGASTILKNNVSILTAGGGGAKGGTAGLLGGLGTGLGGLKPNKCGYQAGNGINGGGGGSTGNCSYQTTEQYACQIYDPNKKCTNYVENCSSNSSTVSCAVCLQAFSQPSQCDGFYHVNDPGGGEGYWCNGCNPYTQTYDCPGYVNSTCTHTVTKISLGNGGQGGNSSLGTDVILLEKEDGKNLGDGKIYIEYLGES